MSVPEWAFAPLDGENFDLSIIGSGPDSRKSKTFIPNIRLAAQLDFIKAHYHGILQDLRECHQKWFTKEVVIGKEDDGTPITAVVPEVLSDAEICARYSGAETWRRVHQEAVEHFASIEGFSVDRTTGSRERRRDEEREERRETSSGADRRTSEPRWK